MAKIKYPKIIVDEYTSPIEATARPDASIDDCHSIIKEKGYRHLPISNDEGQTIVGLLSQRDINLLMDNVWEDAPMKAEHIMRTNLYIVDYDSPLEEVVFQLSDRKIGSALVRDESGSVSGIFTTTDAMNALIDLLHRQ